MMLVKSGSTIYTGKLTGTSFDPARSGVVETFLNVKEWDKVTMKMVHMPDNQYDPNAIRVVMEWDGNASEVGWIPSTINKKFHEIGLNNLSCRFFQYNMSDGVPVGISVIVECM